MIEDSLSQCGGDLTHNTFSPPLSDELDVRLKKIVINRCDFCQIGIGKSMLFDKGTWREHNHICKEAKIFKYGGKTMRVCVDCYERLKAAKDPAKYIKKRLKGTKYDT